MIEPDNHILSANFEPTEDFARTLDARDVLAKYRQLFHLPKGPEGKDLVYLAGNSLGLQPKFVGPLVQAELDKWGQLGVEGHFEEPRPWYSYHEQLRETGAKLVGALPGEVVVMNSLTVNLHFMMASFYRPQPGRYKILIEDPCFPSDLYAVQSQLRHHGYNPDAALLVVQPRPGEHLIRTQDVESILSREGKQVVLVLLSGVNFVTGQVLDMARITAAAHAQGCFAGFDLAHATGNIPLALHDWDVDFAVWCNYKYLNGGPGAVGGCFVHQRHGKNTTMARLAGWWGNDPKTRFRMQLNDRFVPREGAEGWQLSNPPILALAPVKVSYDIFAEVGMEALRQKSIRLTSYLEFLLGRLEGGRFEVITSRDPTQRGCQLSLKFHERPKEMLNALREKDVICDFREPDIIRLAPAPLYNSFHDVWRCANALEAVLMKH